MNPINLFTKSMSIRPITHSIVLSLAGFSVTAETIEHSLGTINLDGIPQRIVVLGHGSLDYLDALGVQPVGVLKQLLPEYLNQYDDKAYTATGAAKEPNFETIFSLKPDLIIAEGRQAELYNDLSSIAPVYMFQIDNQDYWKTTQHHWRTLATVFDRQERTEQMIKETQAKIDSVKAKVNQQPSEALVIMNNGKNLAMFGEKSRFSLLFDEMGFVPVSSIPASSLTGKHGNLISFEYIADAKPEVMFILDREQAIGQSSGKAKALFDNDLVNATPAASNQRMVFLDSAAWYLSAGGYQATQIMVHDAQTALN